MLLRNIYQVAGIENLSANKSNIRISFTNSGRFRRSDIILYNVKYFKLILFTVSWFIYDNQQSSIS